jgi:hypothetical protein
MTVAYDPFASIADENEAAKKSREARERELARDKEWGSAWYWAIRELSADRFLDLGEVLRAHDAAFWLERLECQLARNRHVVEVLKFGHYKPWASLHEHVICLHLLKLAFIGSTDALISYLHKIDRDLVPQIRVNMDEVRSQMTSQVRGVLFPPTPLMTRPEFALACRRKLPGFDKSGIAKKIKSGELLQQLSIGPTRETYHMFELRCPPGDQQRQLTVLKLAVAQIRKCKETSFLSDPVWVAESDGIAP